MASKRYISANSAIHWKVMFEYRSELNIVDVGVYEYLLYSSHNAHIRERTPFVNCSVRNLARVTKTSCYRAKKSLEKWKAMGIISETRNVRPGSHTSYKVNRGVLFSKLEEIYRPEVFRDETRLEYLIEYLSDNLPPAKTSGFELTPKIRKGKFNIANNENTDEQDAGRVRS